jgi:glycosyltransferase involved in cell wall biosynthesis
MERARVVCFVNHTAALGGAEFCLLRLVAGMDRRKWHPVLLFSEQGPAVETLRKRGMETYVLPIPPSLGEARRATLHARAWMRPCAGWSALTYIVRLAGFFRTRAVEIVHTNSMKAHLLGGIAAKVCRIPLAWHLRDCIHPAHLPAAAITLMRILARNLPDRLITVSKSVATDALGDCGVGRARVIYDGLDPDCFGSPAPAPGPLPPALWRVGMVGRFAPWKGQHVFLEAAAKLIEQGRRIHFELIGAPLFGEDAYERRLRQFVDSTALQNHVTFTGFVSDVPERIREWHMLVHASTAPDPCPNVVLEAMAAGVPVVGANGGGVPELLDGGRCGGLFAMDDPNALCSAMESVMDDPLVREAYAVKGRERALRLFGSERVVREVESVWEEIHDPKVFARRRWRWLEEPSPPRRGKLRSSPHEDFAESVPVAGAKEAIPTAR